MYDLWLSPIFSPSRVSRFLLFHFISSFLSSLLISAFSFRILPPTNMLQFLLQIIASFLSIRMITDFLRFLFIAIFQRFSIFDFQESSYFFLRHSRQPCALLYRVSLQLFSCISFHKMKISEVFSLLIFFFSDDVARRRADGFRNDILCILR